MAGAYNIDSQVSGYGSPGASAMFGVQQELMRRAELAQAEKDRQAALLRQQQQDALRQQQVEQEIAASKENVASNVELRAANAAARTAAAQKTGQDDFFKTQGPGAITPAAADIARKVGLGHLVVGTTVPAQPGSDPLPPGDEGPTMPPTPEHTDLNFTGNVDQQEKAAHKVFAQEVLNGEHDTGDEAYDKYQKLQATQLLASGKEGSIPAGVVTPPKSAAESKSAHDIAIEKVLSKPQAEWTPEETAMVNGRKAFNKLQGAEAASRLSVTVDNTNTRQEKTQLFQTKQTFRHDLSTEQTKLDTDLERVDRAQTVLDSPNFLADAVAAPEVLQIMAGGMGSGLRMTDAELNKVNSAQNKLDQARAALAKWGIGAPKTLQDEIRKNMKDLIETVRQARERKAALMEQTLTDLDAASTPEQVDRIHAQYWTAKRKAAKTSTGTPAGQTVPTVKPESKFDF